MIKKYNIKLYKNKKLDKNYNNIKGIHNKNSITLILDEIKTIIREKQLIRENDEFKFILDINKKESNYLLKKHNLKYDIKVIEANIERKEKEIIIKYQIETNEELITIKIIESM